MAAKAFNDEMQKIAFMKVEDLEDDFLGTGIHRDDIAEMARQLLEKEKEKSFSLRHPLLTGLPTLGLLPLIKEQYALRRVGRNVMRKNPELRNMASEAEETWHRREKESDEANKYVNTAATLAAAYLAGKSMDN